MMQVKRYEDKDRYKRRREETQMPSWNIFTTVRRVSSTNFFTAQQTIYFHFQTAAVKGTSSKAIHTSVKYA